MPVDTEELPVTDASPRIPRPPNAFMLFRSNMLKTKAIPATAERRQQQLSKVAGECWNLMSPEEKQVWHDEAARRMREHQLKYPNYKFAP
ncbi:high mobility group box domain-containing protein, partial [Lentinula raphanica]